MPIYPIEGASAGDNRGSPQGLTKREYFAAIALQGILANGGVPFQLPGVVDLAIQTADALIEGLNEPKPE